MLPAAQRAGRHLPGAPDRVGGAARGRRPRRRADRPGGVPRRRRVVAAVSGFLVVTGTDTGVGKTVATAALALGYAASGLRVHVDKPVQTGVGPHVGGDVAEIARLVPGVTTSEGLRLPEPMAPVAAAGRVGIPLPDLAAQTDRLRALARGCSPRPCRGGGWAPGSSRRGRLDHRRSRPGARRARRRRRARGSRDARLHRADA